MAERFDLETGRELKAAGMDEAAAHRREVLELAQLLALNLARHHGGLCDIDLVQARLIALGYSPAELGNAAGSVFKGKQWVFTGVWKESTRVGNHARCVRVWRLAEEPAGVLVQRELPL